MSIIIRLQNLPWSANSADIRHFFHGLEIPDGGVHIIGGERGDAFIAFRNDEDARQAMMKDNLNINENCIRLFLSSRVELQQLIEKVREVSVSEGSLLMTEHFQPRECYRSPVHFERKSPARLERKSPVRLERKSPVRLERKSPVRLERKSPVRLERKSPVRLERKSPVRLERKSPVRLERKSPDRNIRRRSPDRNIRRRSPDRTSRRRSPDRTARRKSPDRVARRGPLNRNSRKRSEDRGARRSSERFNRRRSPYGHHRSRERSRRRSRSPITSRNRSRSFDRHSSRTQSHSQVERRVLPTNRTDRDYPDTKELHVSSKEEQQNPENFRNPPHNGNFQHDIKSFQSSQLYERRSPTKDFPTINVFSNYNAEIANRDLVNSRDPEEPPYSGFPPGSQTMRDEPLNSRREFGIRASFHEDPMPLHQNHTSPFLVNPDRPPFEKPEFFHQSMSMDAPRPFNSNEGQANLSTPIFNPQAMDRFSSDEGGFPNHPSRDEGGFPNHPSRDEGGFLIHPSRDERGFPNRSSRDERGFPNRPSRDENFLRMDFQESHFEGHQFQSARVGNHNFNQNNADEVNRPPNYCLRMFRFGPNDTFKDIQSVLKGVYAPQKNIRFEVNNRGCKTGVVFVKISNEEDFRTVLQSPLYYPNDNHIEVNRCSDEVYWKMFPRDRVEKRFDDSFSQDFVYMLKGLPYSTVETEVINFFKGLKLIDLLILYDKNGKATGTGYVEFENPNDYKIAFERNGKKIAHRYIELLKSSREDIIDAKKTAVSVSKPFQDILQVTRTQGNTFFENSTNTMSQQQKLPKRPLCVLLSGLPPNVRNGQIYEFFSESGITPHAVHILLNNMQRTNGNAYAEFLDPFDLDIALKQHRKFFFNFNPVSIKQVLFEEMVKILDTNQAVHAFENRSSVTHTTIPEKAPYIWDPDEFADTGREAGNANVPSKSWRDNSQNFNFDKNHGNADNKESIQVFDYSHHGDFPSGGGNRTRQLEKPLYVKPFDEDMDAYPSCFSPASTSPVASRYVSPPMRDAFFMDSEIGRETNRPFEAQSNQRRKEVSPFKHNLPEHNHLFQSPKPPESRSTATYATEEDDRAPVKFEMKTRQPVVKSTKVNDAFGKADEGKMKLRKLSPVKVDKIKSENRNREMSNKNHETSNAYKKVPNVDIKSSELKFLEKDFKSSIQKNFDEKKCTNVNTKSTAVVDKSVTEKKPDFNKGKGDQKNDIKQRGKDFKTKFRGRGMQNKKNYTNFDSPPKDPDDIFQLGDVNKFDVVTSSCVSFGEIGTTVQASNVHPDIGFSELMDFFHGFNLRADDIIRRFTDFGTPTSDIRVAFRNSQDAERAIRTLNYKALRGTPIKMFVV